MSFPARIISGPIVFWFFIILLLLVPLTCPAAAKEASLHRISHNGSAPGAEVVEFELTGITPPKAFMIPGENPRLVVDFFSTAYGGSTLIEPAHPGLVQRIRVGFHNIPDPKTRVVIDLLPNREIDWEKTLNNDNNTLRFTFKEKGKQYLAVKQPAPEVKPRAAVPVPVLTAIPSKVKKALDRKTAATEPATAVTKNMSQQPAAVKNKREQRSILQAVDFDDLQMRNGEMVLFKLKEFNAPTISAHEKGRPKVICDFDNTSLARDIASHIEAQGKLVDTIDVVAREGNRTRVVVNLYPGKDYDLQQVFFQQDKLFVLIVTDLALKR